MDSTGNNNTKVINLSSAIADTSKTTVPKIEKAPQKSSTKTKDLSDVIAEELALEKKEKYDKIIQFAMPESMNEEAAIKLEVELETAKTNMIPVFPIVRYLKNKCIFDDNFAELVNNKAKTLKKCFEYVTSEIKKCSGDRLWLDDNEVYAIAETYYMTDEAVFEKIAAEKAAAEKKRQEEVAKIRKEQEEKRKKNAESKKKKAPSIQTPQKEVPAENPTNTAGQLCLFEGGA